MKMTKFLTILILIYNVTVEYLRSITFFIIAFLIIADLLGKFFPKNKHLKIATEEKLTAVNYVGIVILIFFVIWPNISEMSFGNFSVKKLEQRVVKVEETVNDLFNRKMLEYWYYEDFSKFNFTKKDDNKYYNYEINLKYKPIKKSVELWLGQDLQNPMYYTVSPDDKKIIYRSESDFKNIKLFLGNQEPAITIQYIVDNK
jgi:hypothetical protein